MLTAYYKNFVLPDGMSSIYGSLERDMLVKIAHSIKKFGKVTSSTDYLIMKANEMGILHEELLQVVAKHSVKARREIERIFKEASIKSFEYDKRIYERALKQGYPVKVPTMSDNIKQVIDSSIDNAKSLFNLTNTKALQGANRVFTMAVDKAYLGVSTGAMSFDTAYKGALKDLAFQGIKITEYARNGRIMNYSLEAGVRRDILTSVGRTTSKIQEKTLEDTDTHLVETTAHAGARPSHADWQGKVFWYKKPVKGYESFIDVCGYGSITGICGINCYHDFYPYFEGVSSKSFDKNPSRELGISNDKHYELNQTQRRYESRIRDVKKELAVMKAGGNQEMIDQARQKLSMSRKTVRDFISENEKFLNRDYSREAII